MTSHIVPGMIGKFELHGKTPITIEHPSGASGAPAELLTGFTALHMGPRTTGIKVALKRTIVDATHTTFALDTDRAPDGATCTYIIPSRCGPTTQHGTVSFDAVNTTQPPPLSIPVSFPRAFASTPQVTVWLSELDFPTGTKLAVETRAANITPAGFTLFITGLMDLPRALNSVSWVAFEETKKIASGTFVMGKGSEYKCARWHAGITERSEVFMAFNTFSGPPDLLQWVMEDPKREKGVLSVAGRSVNMSLCSTGVAYIVLPEV